MERLPRALALRSSRGFTLLRAAPVLLVAVVLPLDLLTPVEVPLWVLLASLPPMAALVNGPRTTILVAVAALIGCAILLAYRGGEVVTADPYSAIMTTGLIGVIGVAMAILRDQMLARLLSVVSVAETAQRALLPELPSRIGRLECAAVYRAAAADSRLGGDFFDLVDTPWGVRAVIGDVSGHGLDAVATMSALLGSFREGAIDDVDLTALGIRLERRLAMRNGGRTGWDSEFATALLMTFDPSGESVEFRSFGHHSPLLLRSGQVRPVVLDPAPPLGLAGEVGVYSTSVGRTMRPGDMVLTFTDGLVEARDHRADQYPLTERLREHLDGGGSFADARALATFVTEDVVKRGYRYTDDLAVFVIGVSSEGRT
ncbi:PP2C family protein-serine/threonine phosphatase [Glycomyces sp. NPDC046736]|uniref:PP2C family protein-serine/threonine phosphatase n=1 Tax=Glycomyces sp. NPDC046736 TaxID=3155615 RepID=UPI0033C22581